MPTSLHQSNTIKCFTRWIFSILEGNTLYNYYKTGSEKQSSQDINVIILLWKHSNCHSLSFGWLTATPRTPPYIITAAIYLSHTHAHTILFISLRGLMWGDGKDIQGWVSVVRLELLVRCCIHTHTHTPVTEHLCISAPIANVWSGDIIVTLLAGWQRPSL